MAKLKIDFNQAKDHLKLGMDITTPQGEVGKVVAISPEQIDIEIEKPGTLLVNHYVIGCSDEFEIDSNDVDNKAELERRCAAASLAQDELVTQLMDEIEDLKARLILVEALLKT